MSGKGASSGQSAQSVCWYTAATGSLELMGRASGLCRWMAKMFGGDGERDEFVCLVEIGGRGVGGEGLGGFCGRHLSF